MKNGRYEEGCPAVKEVNDGEEALVVGAIVVLVILAITSIILGSIAMQRTKLVAQPPQSLCGGVIPTTSAAPKLNSFGTNLGHCTNSTLAKNVVRNP